MRNVVVVGVAVLALQGCSLFEKGRDLFEGLTNPLVAQGMVVGVEGPDGNQIDLSGSGYEDGTTVTVFLADSADAGDLENAPVTGATVTAGAATATEQAAGVYVVAPGAGLPYAPGNALDLTASIGKDTAVATIVLPAPATVTVPDRHDAGTSMSLSLGDTYESVLAVVVSADGGVTWSNQPETVKELYDLTRDTEVTEITIPGEAFPTAGVYAVGVAGMENTEAADLDNMNTALSNVMAGKMKLYSTIVQ